MVPVCTPTLAPQISFGSILEGLPFLTAKAMPALKVETKSTDCIRSLVMVKLEMPASYLVPMAGMMVSKEALTISPSSPMTLAMAFDRSTS